MCLLILKIIVVRILAHKKKYPNSIIQQSRIIFNDFKICLEFKSLLIVIKCSFCWSICYNKLYIYQSRIWRKTTVVTFYYPQRTSNVVFNVHDFKRIFVLIIYKKGSMFYHHDLNLSHSFCVTETCTRKCRTLLPSLKMHFIRKCDKITTLADTLLGDFFS